MQITNHITSKPCVDDLIASIAPETRQSLTRSPYVASAVEVMKNHRQNPTAVWFKDGPDENDQAGKFAFQRLRQNWFTPHVTPKFKLRRSDKLLRDWLLFCARPWKTACIPTALLLRARRRNFPNFSPPGKVYQGSDLRISTTRIRY